MLTENSAIIADKPRECAMLCFILEREIINNIVGLHV